MCTRDVAIEDVSRGNNGHRRLKASCDGESKWSLYLRGRISPALVVARSISAGEVMTSGDVTIRDVDSQSLRQGFFTDSSVLAGREAVRTISPGDVLTSNMLRADNVIRRGDRLTLIARGNGFEVRIPAQAMEAGAVGEQIRVRNLSSGKEIRAIVVGRAVVEMP